MVGPTQGSITESSATVSSTGVFFGVVTGMARPFREAGISISDPLPSGAPANVPRFDENPERIRVDSDAQPGTTALDVAAGTVITNLIGEMDYSFRAWTILPEAASPPTVGSQPGSTPAPVPNANELTIASFNMERFFDTTNDPNNPNDPVLTATAFNKRLSKASQIIRNVQKLPDVIGVEEMENLSTLQAVAAQVNSDVVNIDGGSNPNYHAYLVEGNDIGGIDVGFLVKESRVTTINVTQIELAGCDHVTASTCYNYTDPNTGALDILNDRPPLVLQASIPSQAGGTFAFIVIVNHTRSLSGIDDNTAAGAGTVGARVREKRRKQAEFLANYIQNRQTADPTEKIITVGDLNAFRVNDGYVDVIGTILGTPAPPDQVVLASSDLVNPNLTDLLDTLPATEQYSYNFDGNAQTLDHIIVNRRAFVFVDRFAYARNDSDFPVKNYESTNELRLSDHDQPVAYFNLAIPPTAAPVSLSGRVVSNDGVPLSGVVMRLEGSQAHATITDSNGHYSFNAIEPGEFYSLTPSRANFSFDPPVRTFNLVGSRTDAVFTAKVEAETMNPLDTPEYFVRQQYLDFLGREPDEGGLYFWTAKIKACSADPVCIRNERINISAAFFMSDEFQESGFYVYRLSKAALGGLPDYERFMQYSRRMATGSETELSREAFAESFVQQPEFIQRYPQALGGRAFVDALLQSVQVNSGIDLSLQRSALIDDFNAQGSRARTLRLVAENSSFVNAEYNRAFVLMEYFGYLRRNPDSAGYDFWLNVLNDRVPGNYRGMVCAFLSSVEYQRRFGSIVSHSNGECSQ